MMKTATVDRPTSTTPREMGRIEAEAITKDIQGNFNSLGSMLLQARDEKAYKALGYRSFEGYCKNEFGKSKSSAYRSIEDAQVRAQLEAEISKKYDKPVSLSISNACLKPLKELPNVSKRLEAIDYANKIAEEEGRKPEKKDLEIAAFKIGGHRPDDFKKAIESLGFTKDTAVEVIATSRRDRGVVKKVDKRGKIHVQLHNGGVSSIAYDSNQLRILNDTEKPAIPADDNTLRKGDKVKIFARGLEGKTGEIYTWKMGRHAMVIVDGQSAPTDIAYAELELIQEEAAIEVKIANKWQDTQWLANGNNYYYFEKENKIVSSWWPTGLSLEPYSQRFESPAEFMEQWQERFAPQMIKALTNSELESLDELRKENGELRARLSEAEAVIKEIVGKLSSVRALTEDADSTINIPELEDCSQWDENFDSVYDYYYAEDSESKIHNTKALGISFCKTIEELLDGKKTQTRRLWQDGYASNFIRYFEERIAIPALDKGRHRGGHELGHIRLTQRPYQQLLSEMTTQDLLEEGGMVETTQEFIDTFFQGQDKLIWVLHFKFQRLENTAENPTPGDTAADSTASASNSAAHADFLIENTPENSTPEESWFSILEQNDFVKIDETYLDEEPTEVYRDWDIYIHDSDVVDISNSNKGVFSVDLSQYADTKRQVIKPIEWAKHIINQVEDFCPGQLSLTLNPTETSIELFPQEMIHRVEVEREKLFDRIENFQVNAVRGKTRREKEINAEKELAALRSLLADLEKFEQLGIGQIVWHKNSPEISGKITGFSFSPGGMPHVFVKWDSEEDQFISTEIVSGILVDRLGL